MQLGIALPQLGRLADPMAVRTTAEAADELGYASVWVADDLGGGLDPVDALTLAASVTTRVGLGTSVLVTSRYQPDVLRRTVSTLVERCEERLTVGIGIDPASDPAAEGAALSTALDVLADLQRRPPILLRCASEPGLDLVARRADGWNPTMATVDRLGERWAALRAAASAHGRDAGDLRFVARLDVHLDLGGSTRPGDSDRLGRAVEDLRRATDAGADEVIVGVAGDPCLDDVLGVYAFLAETLESVAPEPLG